MAVTVTIAGVDKSSLIDWQSLSIEQVVTNQVDSCDFKMLVYDGKPYRPTIGDSIVIEDNNPLFDDFNSRPVLDPTLWGSFNAAQVSILSGQLKQLSLLAGNYAGVYSLDTFNMTANYAQTKLVSAGDQTITSFEVYPVLLELDGSNRLSWYVSQNVIKAYKIVGGVTTQVGSTLAYNSSTMIYFRIRESGGTLYWEYSADNDSWTTFTTLTNPFAVTALRYYIQIGTWQAEASTTYALFDDATIGNNTVPVFGGTVVRIDDSITGGVLTRLSVSCVSHERTLDRYLVSREFTSVNARYMLNTIIADFVNRVTRAIDSGESTETWTQEDGTVAATTTANEYVYGSQARKFTATASNTATGRSASALVLSQFDDGSSFGSSDYVKLWIKVDTIANLTSVRVRMVTDTGATYTNYYEYTILASQLAAGWNEIVIAKSAFSTTGSPSWANIQKRQYRVTASSSGTVNVVIDDVRLVQASTYFSQFGVTDADTPTLGSAKFNYEQVSDAIKQIADAVGNDWYVDPTRGLHFYQASTIPAPFSLTDSSENFVWNSLAITNDLSTIKNQVYVRGGEYQGSTTTYDQTADGNAINFRSPYKLKNIAVSVGGVSRTVGIDNIDDPASFYCLYNFNEKNLKFPSANKPSNGTLVSMTGNPMIPVIVKRGDATSIAAHGVFEHVIIDKSINTLQGARDRAAAELRNYRDTLVEGSFKTDTIGLRAGMTISIVIAARDINETFIIQTIGYTMKSPTEMIYEAKLVSTRSFGIIEYLLTLLRNERKQIDINDSETVDLVQDISEEVTTADSWVQGSINSQTETITITDAEQDDLNHGTVFVLAPYTPSGFADTKRVFLLDGSLLS